MAKVRTVEEIQPIATIDNKGIIYTKNADIAVAFEVTFPEIFCVSEHNYQLCFDALLQGVKNLGEGYLIHKQDFFIEDKYEPNLSYNVSNDFIIAKNELQFKDRAFTNHKAFIYVILPSSNPLKRDSLASAIFRRHFVPKDVIEQETIASFWQKVKSFQVSLNQSKILTVSLLKREDFVGSKQSEGLLNYYFSLAFDDKNLYDLSSNDGIFRVGNKQSYTFVINDLEQYPHELPSVVSYRDYSTDRTKMPASYGLAFGLNLQFNHVYNQVIYIPKQNDLKTKMMADAKKAYSFSRWSRDNTYSVEQKTMMVDSLTTGASLAVHAHFNIQIFHESKQVLEQYKNEVSSAIQNTGFIAKMATTHAEQLFWSCIPANAVELGKDNFATCLLDNALALWNVETNYKQSVWQNGGMLLTDRFGTPRIVDLFFDPLKRKLIFNRNFTVIGPSGSGKSFTMNNMIYYLLMSGSHITIIDIGHSYKRLAEILGGKYLTHTTENPIRLNPFYMEFDPLDDRLKLEQEFKQVIVDLLSVLYKNSGDAITKSEEVTLLAMVTEYYKYLQKNTVIYPCFDTFYEYIRDSFKKIFEELGGRNGKEFDLEQFLFVLKPFYSDGEYGYLLNSKEIVDFSQEPFVVYELDNIKDDPILLPVITLVITNTYVTKLMGVKGTLKMLVIEEAWRAVSNHFFANFLLWAFKTVRKHFGALGVVTQEIEDLKKSEIIKDAIIQNTDIKILLDLRNYKNEQDFVLQMFKLSDEHLPQIFSINKRLPIQRGNFNELAIKLGSELKVYGVEVSPYAYALYTTEPTEVDKIKAIAEERNISQKDAAILWAEQTLIN
ncbi:MAG: TraG family conjugative transposon ATPase [Spirosomataceae bacterium]